MSWDEFVRGFFVVAADQARNRSDLTNGQVWALIRFGNALRGIVSWEGVTPHDRQVRS